jgi:hypothetical protein
MKANVEKYTTILFPFLIVFVFIPTELYYFNAAQWNDVFLLISLAITGLLLGLLVIPLLILFCKFTRVEIEKVVFLIFLIGVYFLLSDVYAPLQLPRLDGTSVESDEPLFYTLVELLIFAVLLLIGIFFNRAKNYKHAVFLSQIGITAISLFFLFAIVTTTNPDILRDGNNKAYSTEYKTDQPNVYHILLDGMQTDYFLKAVEENDAYRNDLNGFTLFKKNVTNYPYTQYSSASYFTGTRYTGGDLYSWLKESKYGIFNMVKAKGYELTVYGRPELIKVENADVYKTQDKVFLQYSEITHPRIKEFVRLWFARVAPNAVTNLALKVGGMLGDIAATVFTHSPSGVPTTVAEGIDPYASLFMFRDLIQSEKYRPEKSSYLYFHVMIPHDPYVLDSACAFSKPQGTAATLYMGQAKCGIRNLMEFLDELKREGKYNDALIIVHGDHGSGHAGFLDGEDGNGGYISSNASDDLTPYRPEILAWSKQQVESRTMALLMIKPPGSIGEFAVNDSSSTQLLDLYPTVLDFLGISPPIKVEGQSLMSCLKDSSSCDNLNMRNIYFNYFSSPGAKTKDVEELLIGFNELGRPEFLSSQIKKASSNQ